MTSEMFFQGLEIDLHKNARIGCELSITGITKNNLSMIWFRVDSFEKIVGVQNISSTFLEMYPCLLEELQNGYLCLSYQPDTGSFFGTVVFAKSPGDEKGVVKACGESSHLFSLLQFLEESLKLQVQIRKLFL